MSDMVAGMVIMVMMSTMIMMADMVVTIVMMTMV